MRVFFSRSGTENFVFQSGFFYFFFFNTFAISRVLQPATELFSNTFHILGSSGLCSNQAVIKSR